MENLNSNIHAFKTEVQQDLEILDSISAIQPGKKYSYYPKDGKFYPPRGIESIYRRVYGLKVDNTIQGIKETKQKIQRTLRKVVDVDPQQREEVSALVLPLIVKLSEARKGLQTLEETYSASSEKQEQLKEAIND